METQFMFDNLIFIHLLWIVLGLAIFSVIILRKKKELLIKFTSQENFQHLTKVISIPRQGIKLTLKLLGMLFIILAIMRPLGSPEPEVIKVKGRDIVFVLDVSKSMLAEDEGLKSSRLERAKYSIRELVNDLSGDRVALVVFSGGASLKCPLTHDYNFFKTILSRVSTHDISRGGTLIGDAIRFVNKTLLSEDNEEDIRYKDIILITDGEDQESFPIEAAKGVVEKGIRIHTVGIGSLVGTKIPIKDEEGNIKGFIKNESNNNEYHKSVLNEDTLKEIALITNGVYISAKTNILELNELYKKYIAVEQKKESESQTKIRWKEQYQLFLLIAIILITLSTIISERKRSF